MRKKDKITTTLSVGGNNQVEKVLDWLYHDATIYLPRKHERYLKFKERKALMPYVEFNRLHLSKEQTAQIIELYENGMASNKIAAMFDISKPSVLKILHDNNVIMRLSAAHPKSERDVSRPQNPQDDLCHQ